MRRLWRVRPQVGPPYLTTSANPYSSCTLSCLEPWDSCIISTICCHHSHQYPCWYPSCVSPGSYHFLSYTSCTSRPLPGPTYGGNPRDCLFSLSHTQALTCQLPRIWMSQLPPACPRAPLVPLPPKLLFFLPTFWPHPPLLPQLPLCPQWQPWTHCCWLSFLWRSEQRSHLQQWWPWGDLRLSWLYKSLKGVLLRYEDWTPSFLLYIGLRCPLICHSCLLSPLSSS